MASTLTQMVVFSNFAYGGRTTTKKPSVIQKVQLPLWIAKLLITSDVPFGSVNLKIKTMEL